MIQIDRGVLDGMGVLEGLIRTLVLSLKGVELINLLVFQNFCEREPCHSRVESCFVVRGLCS